MRKLLLVSALVALVACTDRSGATKALEDAGYSNIETGGYAAFACSKDDSFQTSFKATGPTGRPVTGAVCSGLFKGHTIRTN